MSYNVDHVAVLSGELEVSPEGRAWLVREDRAMVGPDAWLPESVPDLCEPASDGWAKIRHFWWSGESSGNAVYYGAFEKFIGFTRGSADIVLVWEGGDSMTGYRVSDGEMVEHNVVMTLGEPLEDEEVQS